MKMIEREFLIESRREEIPVWASKVERWFQLDLESYAVCEALNEWIKISEVASPDIIINASLWGSYKADADFVSEGAMSPSKFVYTLPNILVGVMAQFLSWKGPTFNFTGENSWNEANEMGDLWVRHQVLRGNSHKSLNSLIVGLDYLDSELNCIKVKFRQIQREGENYFDIK